MGDGISDIKCPAIRAGHIATRPSCDGMTAVQQQKEIQALTAQIQKLSDQVEVSTTVQQLVSEIGKAAAPLR